MLSIILEIAPFGAGKKIRTLLSLLLITLGVAMPGAVHAQSAEPAKAPTPRLPRPPCPMRRAWTSESRISKRT